MNLASIIILCIVVGLFAVSIVCSKSTSAKSCNGNCVECEFRCNKEK
jgi:hypothetical protein